MSRIRMSVALAAGCAAVVLLSTPPAGMRQPTRDSGDEDRELPSMLTYYYEQRLYGNPGVDIQARLWDAYEALAERDDQNLRKGTNSTVWIEQGPWNIGGRVRSLAVDPADPNVLYAGSASGGVWKSTNLGVEWFPLTDQMPTPGIGAVAVDQNDPRKIFAGTGEPLGQNGRLNATFIIARSQGIFRSDDAGASWRLMPWASGGISGVHRIALNPISSDTLLVATMTNLWKSTNGGGNWYRSLSGTLTDVVYAPANPSRMYAAIGADNGGGSNGVYVSDAGGEQYSWRRLGVNFPPSDSCCRIVLGVSPANPQRLYAAVALSKSRLPAYNSDFLVMMVSNNAGETWERKQNAIPRTFTNGQSWYDFALGVSPSDPDFVMLGGLNVWKSSNGGATFSQVSNGSNVHVDIHSFAFQPGIPDAVLVGCDGGVYYSANRATSWIRRVNKLGTVQYYSCTYDPVIPRKIFGGTQDNGSHGRLSDDNSAWASLFGGDGGNIAIDPGNTNVRYYTSASAGSDGTITRPIWRSGIGQNKRLDDGMNGGSAKDRFTWVPALLMHPADRTWLFTATQYVYRMKNPDGANPTWILVSDDLGNNGGIVSDMDISTTNKDWAYAVTSNGRAAVCQNLLSSDPTWSDISSGLPNRWISDVTVDWNDEQTAYVAVSGFGSGHVYKTSNAGLTWTDLTGDLPDIPANAILRSRTDQNVLFLATDLGVFFTTDGGQHWSTYGSGLPTCVVYDMRLTPENVLVAGTHGRGMWIASSILSADRARVPDPALALEQNYPNPFNPSTTIAYTLGRRSVVTLRLFDERGRAVRAPVSDLRDAGRHEIRLDLQDLPAGVYAYTLEADGRSVTRRMVFLK